jgi:methyl-accepting chemotaxis protein
MGLFGLLHHDPGHRGRQLRWVLPLAGVLLAAVVATLAVQYRVSDQAVSTEFFRAHKTISHTGELLQRGLVLGSAVLMVLVLAIAGLALRVTHRIVRPVHTIQRTLDALVAGELGVRVELHRRDEFREVGEALNRLVDEFAATLTKVHVLVDRIVVLTHDQSAHSQLQGLVQELDRTMDYFRLEPRRTIREDNG